MSTSLASEAAHVERGAGELLRQQDMARSTCLKANKQINLILVEKNKADEIEVDRRTIGIDLHEWKPEDADGLTFDVMDFGGQQIYAKANQYLDVQEKCRGRRGEYGGAEEDDPYMAASYTSASAGQHIDGVKELSQSVCKTAKELTESCHSANNYRGAVRQRSLRMDQDIFNAKFFRPQKP
ncbi:hypothetical protein GUITHDRAFT_111456 [Guillardia theta CCMP2712]|uniref:Uncharacterized protein n=1 Tax=Guillardia theta (strain CCMP2712) TaxID=905079 RepID=L1J2X0_GUITC|nr:hypothetical protein GUITHDRAFT_111456 [Guillardia theta CCMP2712]EKX42484.1 hypothetical protein GUITHDRAFT_111456 [Guillardia theta CCMP2712]|eukprot:XP_005829464.1 hypothetical protein GUITHDRAFT_111456 [Guillardia theta CCMP2712]